MNQPASLDLRPTHPLAGLEGWPKTGPVYGLADDGSPQRPGFWERLGERFRKSPPGDDGNAVQARIWY